MSDQLAGEEPSSQVQPSASDVDAAADALRAPEVATTAARIRELTPELAKLGYPPALIKAVCDPFDYAMKLRTGELIRFSAADPNGDWVWLSIDGLPDGGMTPNEHGYGFQRGIDVRVADIVWITDAPHAHSQSWSLLEETPAATKREADGSVVERRGRS